MLHIRRDFLYLYSYFLKGSVEEIRSLQNELARVSAAKQRRLDRCVEKWEAKIGELQAEHESKRKVTVKIRDVMFYVLDDVMFVIV